MRAVWGGSPAAELEFCAADGSAIEIDFRKSGVPRRVGAIRLHSASCAFGIEISPDAADLICLTVEGRKKRAPRCVPLHDVDIVSLVERAIFSAPDGGVYLETLGLLRRLFEFAGPR